MLIVDDTSTRIISKAMGMYDLMENRVYLVEQLKKKRAPYRQSAPIYFLSPTLESVNRLVEDWTPKKKNNNNKPEAPMYADCIFLYFTKAVPEELFARIKACKPLIKRLKAFSEINVDFIANESRAFHLDMASPNVFPQLFPPSPSNTNNTNVNTILHEMADKLVTVCASLNEYPHIRYKASSQVATKLAHSFNDKFNAFVGSNKSWWYHGDTGHMDRGRSTLMLLSRQDDCLSPLLHEFTYQAMVNDLLELDDEKITVEVPSESSETGMEKKDTLLNDNDDLWVELRGKHIADVIKVLSSRIREIVHSNSGVAELNKKGGKALSMSQMANALKNLPEYREVMSKLSQHMHISHRCMGIFNSMDLMNLSDLEQTMANGTDDEGKGVKVATMVDQVEEYLSNTMDSLNRFRLIAIFIVSQKGLRPDDKDRLFKAARLNPNEAKALSNLESMGYPLLQAAPKNKRLAVPEKLIRRTVDADSDIDYATSRYACDLKGILKQSQMNTLSFTDYPSIYPMPDENSRGGGSSSTMSSAGVSSVRSSTSRYSSKRSSGGIVGGKKGKAGTRMIVFVVGGACYSELRAAQEIMDKGGQEIILGSNRFVNPTEFIKDLESI